MRADLATHAGEHSRIGETLWKTLAASALACAVGAGFYFTAFRMSGLKGGSVGQGVLVLTAIGLVALLYVALARLVRTPDSVRATEMILGRLRRR
jgi:hypothetical protein